MVRFYLETGKKTTSEYVFLKTLLKHWGILDQNYEIECVDGKDSLHLMTNKMKETALEGGKNVIIFDADSAQNGGGFDRRKTELEELLREMGVTAELFLFPNNQDDGDVEVLMETLMQKELHERFFHCYGDYEICLGNDYQAPNLKGKLHTYISAQKDLSNRQRKSLGAGQWLFNEKRFWNIDRETLNPLRMFIKGVFESN